MASRNRDTFNVDALVQQIMDDPELHDHLKKIGDDYVDVVKATWPKSIGDNPTPQSRAERVFEVIPTDRSGNRPYVHVHVNHPYAVAHQARTGAFTKAAAALGLELNRGGG